MMCLVKGYNCGLWFGEVTSTKRDCVTMKNARNIWYWKGAFNLSTMSLVGIKGKDNKITEAVDTVTLMGVDTIIGCSLKAIESISAIPCYNPGY